MSYQGMADYFAAYQELSERSQAQSARFEKRIRIAFLCSFSMNGIKEVLSVQCAQQNIGLEIFFAEYNQYAALILDESSQLYAFKPDLVVLFLDTQSLWGDEYFLPYAHREGERQELAGERFDQIKEFVAQIKQGTQAHILVHNLEVPTYSPLGILESKEPRGMIETLQRFNLDLMNCYKQDTRVFVFDYDGFCASVGKRQIQDERHYYLGDFRLDLEKIPRLCESYLGFVRALLGIYKKCIVLDLDDTLWGGLVGEEGKSGIRLGPTEEGRPFMEFQYLLLALFQRGIVLAVNSRNNEKETLDAIRTHPHMVLREEHFGAIQINWNDKATNLRTIAQELKLGLDSMVFIDDDEHNRALVRQELPSVHVMDLPEDPALYCKALRDLNLFNTLQFTDEDKGRGKSYAVDRKRKATQLVTKNLDAYVKNLEQVVEIAKADAATLPRIAQLIQKTNQFNMTTRRHTQSELQKMSESSDHLVIGVSVRDRFGDSGLVGVMIIKQATSAWTIDTFLLSCRVLGRYIEDVMTNEILKAAHAAGVKEVRADFIRTPKNKPADGFYKAQHFKPLKASNKMSASFQYSFSSPKAAPKSTKSQCMQAVQVKL